MEESYQGRHLVSLIVACGLEARVGVGLTRDAEAVERSVGEIAPGGKTPLAHALALAGEDRKSVV